MRRKKSFRFLEVLIVSLCLCADYAQGQATQEPMAALEEYAARCPVEKLYLHLDKPCYAAGEDIFFRAYLTDSECRPDKAYSHIIYVELIDGKKHVVERTLLYSKQNTYAGQIGIPDSLPAGNYYIRAYTSLMRNRGEEFFFAKDIRVENRNPDAAKPAQKEESWDFECGFYPEGGRLVSGIMSRVAFKALSSDGFGADVEGELQDMNGRKITALQSVHKGMGDFRFIPLAGKPYYALLESRGKKKLFRLPVAVQGASLMCYEQRDTIHLIVQASGNHPGDYHITGQTRDKICYSASFQLKETGQRLLIPTTDLPEGIIRFTLCDGKDIPQCERLIFNDSPKLLHFDILPDKPEYAARESISLEIRVKDHLQKPVAGSFSLAVTSIPGAARHTEAFNIRARMLLTSDLKGYVEEPGWYFHDVSREKKDALDLLLLTQGWTSYKSPDTYPAETDFSVSGKVVNVYGRPASGVKVHMWDISGRNYPGESVTDREGNFGFTGFDAPENTSFLLKTAANTREYLRIFTDRKNSRAEINRLPVYPSTYIYSGDSLTVRVEETKQVTENAAGEWQVLLGEVSIVSQRKYRQETGSSGKTGNTLGGNLLQQFNFDEGLKEALHLLPPPNSRPQESQDGHYGALFLLQREGHPPAEVSSLQFYNYPAWMIERIEVHPYKITESQDGTIRQGVVAGYLKNSPRKPAGKQLRPGLEIYKPEGYGTTKEFYVPPYHTEAAYNGTAPDTRETTLYWQPVLETDSTGKCTAPFYAADRLSAYTIAVEGIGAGGIPGYGLTTFKVSQPRKSKKFAEATVAAPADGNPREKARQGSFHVLEYEDIQKLRCRDIYCLLQHLPQVRINGRHISIGGGPTSVYGGTSPLIIIDGIEGNPEQVDIHSVRRIEVSPAGSMYGARGAGGVIEIKTLAGIK